jgi:diguanylate cyclase (GGDEF)-like protein
MRQSIMEDSVRKNYRSPDFGGMGDRAQRGEHWLTEAYGLKCGLDRAVLPPVSEAELWRLAFTDDLTGLQNRRGFLLLADQQLKLSRRTGRGMLLFFCDLDRLKQINDHFGHSEGDAALVLTAQILRDTFRDSDIIARFGGDEFLIITPEASDEDEAAILHRLEERVKDANTIECRYTYSVSVGVARFDARILSSLEDLISLADLSLYKQKRRSMEKCIFHKSFHGVPAKVK